MAGSNSYWLLVSMMVIVGYYIGCGNSCMTWNVNKGVHIPFSYSIPFVTGKAVSPSSVDTLPNKTVVYTEVSNSTDETGRIMVYNWGGSPRTEPICINCPYKNMVADLCCRPCLQLVLTATARHGSG